MVARQVLSTLDLRTPDQKAGITKKMQTIKSIMGIMQVLGEAEKVRRERQTLDRISRAITGGATTMEAIMAAANQQPQMGTGLPGMLQKIGGQIMPQGGGIQQGLQQGILQNAMTRMLGDPFGKEVAGVGKTIAQTGQIGAEVEFLKGPKTELTFAQALAAGQVEIGPNGKLFNRKTGELIAEGVRTATGGFTLSPGGKRFGPGGKLLAEAPPLEKPPRAPTTFESERKRIDALSAKKRAGTATETDLAELRDLTGVSPGETGKPSKAEGQRDKDLGTIAGDKSNFQKQEARNRLDNNPSQPRKPIPLGKNDENYAEFLQDSDKVDGKFGEKAYKRALAKAEDEARLVGADPRMVKRDFDRWWDTRAQTERTGLLKGLRRNVTTPRSEFQAQAEEPKGTIDKAMAESILNEAGGDKEKAREIARERGYKL